MYKIMRVQKDEEMGWKKYSASVLIFSGAGLIFLFLLQLLQGVLPGNPQGLSGVKWDLSFNTAASFITNTNRQAYSGESALSYLSQALGLTVLNFVSAATGIAASSTWAAFTTAASNGSVNSMHDSYTPLGGMIPMLLMQQELHLTPMEYKI